MKPASHRHRGWAAPILALILAGCSSNALLVAGGAAAVYYYARDGVVWRTDSEQIAPGQYRITVRKQTYTSGDGQGDLYFKRRAQDIAEEQHCAGYRILTYTTSLEPTALGTERVYEGTIECRKAG